MRNFILKVEIRCSQEINVHSITGVAEMARMQIRWRIKINFQRHYGENSAQTKLCVNSIFCYNLLGFVGRNKGRVQR